MRQRKVSTVLSTEYTGIRKHRSTPSKIDGMSESSKYQMIGKKYNYTLMCRIIKDHEEHMREMLKGALEWFCAEKRDKGPFVLKLEAR